MGVDLFAQIKELQKVISDQGRCLGAKNDSWGISHHEKIGGGGGCTFECRFLGFTTWRCPWKLLIVSWLVSWLSISPI